MEYNELEIKIINASLGFAEEYGVEFNEYHQSMMVNAMREVHYNHQRKLSKDTLSDSDIDAICDVYYSVTGETIDINRAIDIHTTFSDDLKADGVRWGLCDSVVRDDMYEFLSKKLKE